MTAHRISAVIFTTALCAAGLTACALGEPRFGVCRQQITDFVELTLGQTPTHIEIQSYAEVMPAWTLFDLGSALVYVKECDGFQAFEIRATEDLCEFIPHYGSSSGTYIRYEGAYEGCQVE
jgi:hypothetical protein